MNIDELMKPLCCDECGKELECDVDCDIEGFYPIYEECDCAGE